MSKRLPLTALITGLLAAPMMGGSASAQAARSAEAPAGTQMVIEVFPPEMPAELGERTRRMARGEKLSAFGMQGLQGKLARDMQARLARLLAERETNKNA